jgi:Tfp pilus assembly protein PilN
MIQFNLLPDVKQEYIKAEAMKRLVISVSFIASAASVSVLLLALFSVYIVQKKSINDLNNDIKTNSATLQNTSNISDILTVQSQLNSLSSLHQQKPVASRLFTYLSQLTPKRATISDLRIDYSLNTLTINGNAPSLDVVNTFVDGLKFTTYTTKDVSTSQNAFSTVVLASFSRSAKSATYSITLDFDPAIFNVANDVTLKVGGQASTQQPSIIFKKEG